MEILILPKLYAICRLDSGSPIPEWGLQGDLFAITRTDEELSIVCLQSNVPDEIRCERDWRALKVAGVLDFSLTGVLSSLATPLAMAGISIFAISTFDTDYLLVKADKLDQAVDVLRVAGHQISGATR